MAAGLLAFRWQRLPIMANNAFDSGKGESAGDLMMHDHQIRITVAGTALVLHEIPF